MNQQTESPEDRAIGALVAADPLGSAAGPDLAALRAGGRRLVRRRRAVLGSVAAVVALAVAVPVSLAVDGGSAQPNRGQYVTDPSASPPTTDVAPAPSTPAASKPTFPKRGEAPLVDGTNVVGEWEDGELLGEVLSVGDYGGLDQVVYAAKRPWPGDPDPVTYVAVGVRVGERILRTVSALSPLDVEQADGVALYGGHRIEEPAAAASFLLVGSVPGDVDVTVSRPGDPPRPVGESSTTVLPGYTVFVASGMWVDDWDPLQAAPFVVRTSAGAQVDVRERSWLGN